MRRRRRGLLSGVVVFGLATATSAAHLTVGAGSTVDLGDGSLDLGCANLAVEGTLAAGTGVIDWAEDVSIGGTLNGESATLYVTGDWNNSGTFNAGSSSVRFVDGCGLSSATISGDSTFFDLEMTTSTGKLVAFEAGSTTTVTDLLTLAGAEANLLTIRSTVDGSEAYLDLQGSQTNDFVDVKDNHAIGNPIPPGPNSVKGPNTPGWANIVLPTLSAGALALLTLSILWAGRWGLRARQASAPTP